jgi:hypothetical protein
MKTRTTVVAIALIAAFTYGFAGEPGTKFPTVEKRIEYALKNIKVALQSDNKGLVRAGMMGVSKIKMAYPSTDVSEVKELLDEMAYEEPSGTVRYEAYLASAICTEPTWYATDEQIMNSDQEHFFIAASNRLQQRLLSSNSY